MRKSFKGIILLLVLLLPVFIFIFLFSQGENKFDVEVQHPKGLNLKDCPDTGAPHTVPAIDSLHLGKGEYKLVYISNKSASREQMNELRRVSNNFKKIPVIVVLNDEESVALVNNYRQAGWEIFLFEKSSLLELNRCGFGNTSSMELVLIDPQNHIRGYYDIARKKELDRLEGEIKILMM